MQVAAARALETLLVPLRPLLSELVLVGGAAIPLWVDAPGAPPARPTNDTDVIVAVKSRVQYHLFGERIRELGFGEVSESKVVCRWRHRATGALYDVMPLDEFILGFSNQWYEDTFNLARDIELPDGIVVTTATAPCLVATKLEAFADRGGRNYLASHDMYDIVALLDGRVTLVNEIRESPAALRRWIASEFSGIVETQNVRDAVLNYLPYDAPPGADELLTARFEEVSRLMT